MFLYIIYIFFIHVYKYVHMYMIVFTFVLYNTYICIYIYETSSYMFFDHQDKVRLLPGEKTLDLQIFSDATFLEASRLEFAGPFSVGRNGGSGSHGFFQQMIGPGWNGPAVHGRNGWNLVDRYS